MILYRAIVNTLNPPEPAVRTTLQRLSMTLVLAALPWLAGWGRAPSALPISPAAIDATVARAMKAFQVPGMAVGIIKDGKLIYAKGYGVRELGKAAQVDADTLFQIGSNTKAFTTAALAMLVDEGKIHWDDRVIDYLPQFRMYDPYVTREFRIRDLLTHRSGLGLGAGDLMFFPGYRLHAARKSSTACAISSPYPDFAANLTTTICSTWWQGRSSRR